jgi:hypothetical protein
LPSLFQELPQTGWAHFSPCGKFRYELWRRWQDDSLKPPVAFIGLNPSVADGENDDHTIRRCVTLARSWGFSSLCMLNLLAFISTDPAGLWQREDNVGISNDHHLRVVCASAGLVIACWGGFPAAAARAQSVYDRITEMGIEAQCLGTTKDGYPRHPSRLPNSVRPQPWEAKF